MCDGEANIVTTSARGKVSREGPLVCGIAPVIHVRCVICVMSRGRLSVRVVLLRAFDFVANPENVHLLVFFHDLREAELIVSIT